MKTSNITKSALALALGLCASGAWAATTTPVNENFQGAAFNNGNTNTVAGITANNLTWADTDGYTAVESGVLVVDAADNPTTAAIANGAKTDFDKAILGGKTATFSADVAFTPATSVPEIDDTNLKFAVFALANGAATNLYAISAGVTNGPLSAVSDSTTPRTLTVTFSEDKGARKFSLKYGTDNTVYGPYAFVNDTAIGQVDFQGNGKVDNIALTHEEVIPFTITWTAAGTASCTVNGDAVALGSSPAEFDTFAGDAVAFTLTNSDGASKVFNATAGSSVTSIDASGAFTWADYLGAAVDGAYTIDDANDLDMLRKGVASGLATSGVTFKQTDNIDMTSAAAFAGIGTYARSFEGGAVFAGTYDGNGNTISNITLTARNYGGIFNQVSGTIKDLTVENLSFPSGATGEYGAAIVGNIGRGATLQHLVASGSFGTSDKPGTHNMAGIVIRASGNGATSHVTACTNNAAIYGTYTKIAGICALTQRETDSTPYGIVVFTDCCNNGAITAKIGSTAGRDGAAGIVGYISEGTQLGNCSNTGTITSTLATAKIGQIVGWAQSHWLEDQGGNTASDASPMVGSYVDTYNDGKLSAHCSVTNFQYATVANNVATTISGSIAVGNTYLLEGNAAPSVSLAYGETVTFDTSLGYTLTESGITTSAAGCEVVGSGTTTRTFSVSYVSVAVSYSAALTHLTAAWTVNGSSVAEPATLTYGDTYSVTFTAESGWAISDGEVNPVSGTAGTTAIVITVPAVEELPSYAAGDTTVIAGHTLTAAEASYLNTLVGNTSAAAVESALASIDEDDFVAATVLNQDITKADAGSYEFNVTKIKKSGSTVKVTVKLTRSGTLIGGINGTLVLQTCATPTGTYADAQTLDIAGTAFAGTEAEATAEFTFTGVTDKFFKAVIR